MSDGDCFETFAPAKYLFLQRGGRRQRSGAWRLTMLPPITLCIPRVRLRIRRRQSNASMVVLVSRKVESGGGGCTAVGKLPQYLYKNILRDECTTSRTLYRSPGAVQVVHMHILKSTCPACTAQDPYVNGIPHRTGFPELFRCLVRCG